MVSIYRINTEAVFNLRALGGAKAAGLQSEIGSLKEGFKADIIVFDGNSSSMLTAAAENPVAAIILHSNPSDISLLLIDGFIRKENGKPIDVVAAAAPVESRSPIIPASIFTWNNVAVKVLGSRKSLKQKAIGTGFSRVEDVYIDMWHMNRKMLLEEKPC